MDEKEAKLEKSHIDQDRELKTRELDLKQRELDLKERELTGKNTRWLTPQQATILVAVIGIVAAAIGSVVQGILSQQLERDRFRTSLILKAVETGDRKQASDNLLRLFEWHLISDPDGTIVAAIKHEPADVPLLPRPEATSPTIDASQNVAGLPGHTPHPGPGKLPDIKVVVVRSLDLTRDQSTGEAKQVSTILTAPGPIDGEPTVSIEGVGAPWIHTTGFETISPTQMKWVGLSTTGAPALLRFTIYYRAK